MNSATRAPRLAAIRDALARADLDGLLITSLPNIRYLTGFSGSSGLTLVTARDCLLLTDFRYAGQVLDELDDAVRVRIEPASLWAGLWSSLASMSGVSRVGFESAFLVHRDFTRLLEQGDRWQWRPREGLVEALRERKDEGEIRAIEMAVAMAERALELTLAELQPGLADTWMAGVLERHLRELGSEGHPFPTIVASGPRSALPHAHAAERIIQSGDLVLFDFGATAGGYCSDITRTVVVGTASAEQLDIHDIVRQANELASGALRAEMSGKAADAIAREYIDARGYGEAFGHSLGHGIGLEVHEGPRLARSVDTPLAAGMVVTIEPGIYLPGWGGVRIEDDVLITESGRRVLTSFPRSLIEVA